MSLTADQLEHYMYRHTAQLLYKQLPIHTNAPVELPHLFSYECPFPAPPTHTHTLSYKCPINSGNHKVGLKYM